MEHHQPLCFRWEATSSFFSKGGLLLPPQEKKEGIFAFRRKIFPLALFLPIPPEELPES